MSVTGVADVVTDSLLADGAGDLTISGSGSLIVPVTVDAIGAEVMSGTAAVATVDVLVEAFGTSIRPTGTGAVKTDHMRTAGLGHVTIGSTGSPAFTPTVVNAWGVQIGAPVTGTASPATDTAKVSASGHLIISGTATIATDAMTASGTAIETIPGHGAARTKPMTTNGAARSIAGTAAVKTQPMTTSGNANMSEVVTVSLPINTSVTVLVPISSQGP